MQTSRYSPTGQGPGIERVCMYCKHLGVDTLCRTAQYQFTEGVEVPFIEELLDRPGRHFGYIHLPLAEALEKFGRCKVYDLDLGCLVYHPVGNLLLA